MSHISTIPLEIDETVMLVQNRSFTPLPPTARGKREVRQYDPDNAAYAEFDPAYFEQPGGAVEVGEV